MKRAYSVLTVKSVSDDARVITGVATTPTADRVGDIVDPLGVKFANPLPLLWQHKHDAPVGTVEFGKPTKDGVKFTAKLANIAEPGKLKDRVDEAWQSVKEGLVRAVSIGFRSIEHELLKTGGLLFKETEVFELSLVTIPANSEATIQTIKSIDKASRGEVEDKRPLSRGSRTTKSKRKDVQMDIDIKVAELNERREELAAEMKGFGDITQLEDEEKGEFDRVSAELDQVDEDLTRAKAMQRAAKAAKPIERTERRIPAQAEKKEELPPGIGVARIARVKALARLDNRDSRQLAKELYGTDSGTFKFFSKAAVAAGDTQDATWASPLVPTEGPLSDFVEFLRPQTIIGRIPGLRRIPFRTRIVEQTSGGAGYWVAEGNAKPVTKFDFSSTSLQPLKVANIAVATMELLRDSSPSAEAIIRDQLVAALRERLDIDFIDPAKAAVAGESPASITNGVTASTSTGSTADQIRADLLALMQGFVAANSTLGSGVWVMPETTAMYISTLLNPLGQPEFPNMTATGGTLFGIPVVTSEHIPAYGGTAPPPVGSRYIFLINASDVYLADEGGFSVDMSQEATLTMDDAPTNPATATFNLWQNNCVGFRAERTINWAKRRPNAVAVLDGVEY